MSDYILPLDPSKRSTDTIDFQAALRSKIVGQEEGVHALVDLYQVFRAGLNSPGRPVGNLLFLGPTGSGKTRIVEAAAEVFFGQARAVVKIDCAEFQHSHEIAKLIGSPPGYLGHRETQPLITQDVLDEHQTEKLRLSLVLFDEIEKASDALWQLLLGILDKGTLTLGDNRRVDFSRTMIFMTSNLGSAEMSAMLSPRLGFAPAAESRNSEMLEERIESSGVEAARKKFSPEFMNRIDKVIVFRTLQRENLEQILDIELTRVQERIMIATAGKQFVFKCTGRARDFLLLEGTDQKFGARHLKRAIERHLVFPLSNLLATGQIDLGDLITVDYSAAMSKLVFLKEDQGALVGSVEPTANEEPLVVVSGARATTARSFGRRARATEGKN